MSCLSPFSHLLVFLVLRSFILSRFSFLVSRSRSSFLFSRLLLVACCSLLVSRALLVSRSFLVSRFSFLVRSVRIRSALISRISFVGRVVGGGGEGHVVPSLLFSFPSLAAAAAVAVAYLRSSSGDVTSTTQTPTYAPAHPDTHPFILPSVPPLADTIAIPSRYPLSPAPSLPPSPAISPTPHHPHLPLNTQHSYELPHPTTMPPTIPHRKRTLLIASPSAVRLYELPLSFSNLSAFPRPSTFPASPEPAASAHATAHASTHTDASVIRTCVDALIDNAVADPANRLVAVLGSGVVRIGEVRGGGCDGEGARVGGARVVDEREVLGVVGEERGEGRRDEMALGCLTTGGEGRRKAECGVQRVGGSRRECG